MGTTTSPTAKHRQTREGGRASGKGCLLRAAGVWWVRSFVAVGSRWVCGVVFDVCDMWLHGVRYANLALRCTLVTSSGINNTNHGEPPREKGSSPGARARARAPWSTPGRGRASYGPPLGLDTGARATRPSTPPLASWIHHSRGDARYSTPDIAAVMHRISPCCSLLSPLPTRSRSPRLRCRRPRPPRARRASR